MPKPQSQFPLGGDTCFDCKHAQPQTEDIPLYPAQPAEDTTPHHFPSVEIDPTNPTHQEIAARFAANKSLLQFIRRFRPKYQVGWVHQDICTRLEQFMRDVEAEKEPRLLLCMPVRHGKSEIASRHFPPFVLGNHPDWEVIAASNAQSLATSFSRYQRDLMRDPSYQAVFPGTQLDPASQSVENWNTTSGGGYLAAGVGTAIIGRGAHVLVIDDPVKDAEAADSTVIRDATWEWFISTAMSRLAPGGGVLVIMCMTGDTPVLLADGTTAPLNTLTPGTSIATYAGGVLAQTRVAALRSNGRDFCLKITMKSGKVVRANGRHPFLTVLPSGGLTWTRAKHLTTTHRIVTVKDSGVNGEALAALPRGASSLPNVADYVQVTTESSGGLADTAQQALPLNLAATLDLSIATASQVQITTPCSPPKKGSALSVESDIVASPSIGKTNSLSITTTPREKFAACSAMTATPESDTLPLSRWHLPPLGISDFTLDEIASVEPDGDAEVFDLQVEHTENFIANGLVSHNTWWNEDDLAGRLQSLSEMEAGGDKYEVVKYPAINEDGDEYIFENETGRPIRQVDPAEPPPPNARLTRLKGTALHPARYTLEALLRRKATYYALGQQRWWSALYQQDPSPQDGVFFTKEMMTVFTHRPTHGTVLQAWDFAITDKQKADWTVGVTGILDEYDTLYIIDVWRFKTDDGIELGTAIATYAKQWSCMNVAVEDGQIWKSIKANFDKATTAEKYYPAITVVPSLTDKRARAQPARGRMQQHKVQFLSASSWWEILKNEFLRFMAGGKHDDVVDAVSLLVRLATSTTAPAARSRGDKLKSWKDELRSLMLGGGGSHMSA